MQIIKKIIKHCIQRVFLYPLLLLSYLVPRNKNVWVFGSAQNTFSDNSKYLFLHVVENEPQIEAVWISGSKSIVNDLSAQGYNAAFRWSFRGVYLALVARYYFYSSYVSDINYWTSGRAFLFNLWHGIPLKRIEYDINVGPLSKRYNSWYSSLHHIVYPYFFVKPDRVLSTSKLTTEIFSRAFRIRPIRCLEFGYPRTDHFLKQPVDLNDSPTGGFKALVDLAARFEKVFIYMPTFRESAPSKDSLAIQMDELNNILHQSNSLLFVKNHSNTHQSYKKIYSNIQFIESGMDVYPLLPFTDVLITDYSSVFFDYMLLNKPMIFYAYDKNSYLNGERGFYFDYDTVVPGPIAEDFQELIRLIQSPPVVNPARLKNDLSLFWTGCGNSSAKIVDYVKSVNL